VFVPRAFDEAVLERFRLGDRAVRYDGFKEEVAAADFRPDPAFPGRLPFGEYVLVRAEAFQAEYVRSGEKSLVPELVRILEEKGSKVLFLPRYDSDRALVAGRSNVHVPPGPVNGLDAAYHARAVLTGSGSFAREAAVLGVPACSFFPGPRLLGVDREMVARGMVFHSRDPGALVDHAFGKARREFDRSGCEKVIREVMDRLEETFAMRASRRF
jgi:hypothetical protein